MVVSAFGRTAASSNPCSAGQLYPAIGWKLEMTGAQPTSKERILLRLLTGKDGVVLKYRKA